MFQSRWIRPAGAVTSVLVLAVMGVRVVVGGVPDASLQDKELQALLRERDAVLQEAVRRAAESYQAGQATLSSVVECQRELALADLELATTPQQRVAVYMRLVDQAKTLKESAEARFKAGQATQFDVLKAQAAQLQAQIDRARAQSNAASKLRE